MFSPETFAILKGLIDTNKASDKDYTDSAISTLTDYANNTFWKHSELSLGSDAFVAAIEASFTAAESKSIYEGSTSQSSQGLAWIGYKNTATTPSKALFFRATSGATYIGVATRDKNGNWTGLKLDA